MWFWNIKTVSCKWDKHLCFSAADGRKQAANVSAVLAEGRTDGLGWFWGGSSAWDGKTITLNVSGIFWFGHDRTGSSWSFLLRWGHRWNSRRMLTGLMHVWRSSNTHLSQHFNSTIKASLRRVRLRRVIRFLQRCTSLILESWAYIITLTTAIKVILSFDSSLMLQMFISLLFTLFPLRIAMNSSAVGGANASDPAGCRRLPHQTRRRPSLPPDKDPDFILAFQLSGICLTLVELSGCSLERLGCEGAWRRTEGPETRPSVLRGESPSDAHFSRVAATHGRKVCSQWSCSRILSIPLRVCMWVWSSCDETSSGPEWQSRQNATVSHPRPLLAFIPGTNCEKKHPSKSQVFAFSLILITFTSLFVKLRLQ